MLNKILDLFVNDPEEDETLDPQLAAAALMFEVVWADHEIDDAELGAMRHALVSLFGLAPARIEEIIAETRREHEQSVGLFHFTRALNDQLDQADKYNVILALWQIAFADDHIDSFEEHMIRRVAELLYVSHTDFIRAKQAARPGEEAGGDPGD